MTIKDFTDRGFKIKHKSRNHKALFGLFKLLDGCALRLFFNEETQIVSSIEIVKAFTNKPTILQINKDIPATKATKLIDTFLSKVLNLDKIFE